MSARAAAVDAAEIAYRPRGFAGARRVGTHPSRGIGTGGAFHDEVPFMVFPDARRIDVRATLRDPFETTFVRRAHPRIGIDLYAVVDLTASLDYAGHARKFDLAVEFCVALASSATRTGDRFGLVGCDAGLREDCFVPASRRRGIVPEVETKLRHAQCRGDSAEGMLVVAERLGGARKMVFVVSDFLLPLSLIERTFVGLARHDVVPVVIGDTSEDVELPDWGLLELADLESRRRRLVFMRPALKQRWLEAEAMRREALRKTALRYGRAPIVIRDRFDADDVSRNLMES